MSTCGAAAAPVSRHPPKTDPPKPGSSRAASECETWAGRRERGALFAPRLRHTKKKDANGGCRWPVQLACL